LRQQNGDLSVPLITSFSSGISWQKSKCPLNQLCAERYQKTLENTWNVWQWRIT